MLAGLRITADQRSMIGEKLIMIGHLIQLIVLIGPISTGTL